MTKKIQLSEKAQHALNGLQRFRFNPEKAVDYLYSLNLDGMTGHDKLQLGRMALSAYAGRRQETYPLSSILERFGIPVAEDNCFGTLLKRKANQYSGWGNHMIEWMRASGDKLEAKRRATIMAEEYEGDIQQDCSPLRELSLMAKTYRAAGMEARARIADKRYHAYEKRYEPV